MGFCEAVGRKVAGVEPITQHDGRSGRPVKKPRFLPPQRAHPLAPKLAARRLGTASVL